MSFACGYFRPGSAWTSWCASFNKKTTTQILRVGRIWLAWFRAGWTFWFVFWLFVCNSWEKRKYSISWKVALKHYTNSVSFSGSWLDLDLQWRLAITWGLLPSALAKNPRFEWTVLVLSQYSFYTFEIYCHIQAPWWHFDIFGQLHFQFGTRVSKKMMLPIVMILDAKKKSGNPNISPALFDFWVIHTPLFRRHKRSQVTWWSSSYPLRLAWLLRSSWDRKPNLSKQFVYLGPRSFLYLNMVNVWILCTCLFLSI